MLRIYPGGNDPRHRQRELALQRLGVEVGLVLPERYGADWVVAPVEPELRSWRSPLLNSGSVPFHLWHPRVIGRAIREFAPDVVDIHEEPYFPSGAQGAWAAAGRPLVMYAAQNLLKPLPPPIAAMQRWVLRRTTACYPCSSEAGEVLRQRGFRGRVEVVPIGVDDAIFEVQPTGDRVGFIGRLVDEKGLRDLLRLGPRLLCIGDGPLRGEIESAGAEVRQARSVDELCAALSEMAVLVAPSRTTSTWKEQFGRMVAEAMAAGVPVVAYASGSLPEVVGDAGTLVAEGDVPALHRAIDAALRDGRHLAAAGRARAGARFSWARVAERMAGVYRTAMAQAA